MTQEDGKENSFYKYALEQSRHDFTDPIGIFTREEKNPYAEPTSVGDKILIRQNNVLMYLIIEQCKILSKIESELGKQLDNNNIDLLITELRNIKPIEPKKPVMERANFVVWNKKPYDIKSKEK